MKPGSIPLLFLISVYIDNQWDVKDEESILQFLVSCLRVRDLWLGWFRTSTNVIGRISGTFDECKCWTGKCGIDSLSSGADTSLVWISDGTRDVSKRSQSANGPNRSRWWSNWSIANWLDISIKSVWVVYQAMFIPIRTFILWTSWAIFWRFCSILQCGISCIRAWFDRNVCW